MDESKVLLVGNGGREHALAWRLAQSPRLKKLFVWPGNPGTAEVAENVAGDMNDLAGIDAFVTENGIGLVAVGPEEPLAAGLADQLAKSNVKVFGPSAAAAQIEADKWFAKELMRQQAVPTAEARSFTDASAAEEYVKNRDQPCVVKAAGLAKGKGVSVCYRPADALQVIDRMLRKKSFGAAGARIVIEELLAGPEVSVMALVDGSNLFVLEPAQDHKAVDDGDTGPMTGGMGAYSPTPVASDAVLRQIERDVLVPIVDGLKRDGIQYRGVLYAGIMLTPAGPKVLEFNCRFGDPETQPLMMRLKSDLLELMLAAADGKLADLDLQWDPRPAVGVVATSKGYPGKYAVGVPITGVEAAESTADVKVFHGGTKITDGRLVTDGGRVLTVTALGDTIADAQARAYAALASVRFEGMHYRRDIAHQALQARR
jgi:phosphoribosylamine--glycine ligase